MNDEWRTPKAIFDKLNAEFHFDIDAAATKENALCPIFFTKEDDALSRDWIVIPRERRLQAVFVNPPYSRGNLPAFHQKAAQEALKQLVTVVMLVPANTDTAYWHEWVFGKASEIRFVKGRISFDGMESGTPRFSSAIVIYEGADRPRRARLATWEQP